MSEKTLHERLGGYAAIAAVTLDAFHVPSAEGEQVVAFIQSTKADIAEG